MTDLKIFPFVAVRGVVPIPNNDFRIEIGRPKSLKATQIGRASCRERV